MDFGAMLQAMSGGGSKGFLTDMILPGASTALNQSLFGREDRISNRDYQFYQDLADSGNPREAARQNRFLEQVTPTNAAMYNQYQDATSGPDAVRRGLNIKTTADVAGMSPWELAGSGGSSPLPSPTIGNSRAPEGGAAGSFMSALTPLAVTKMNNETALKTTAMNNQTALQQTRLSTDQQKYATDTGKDIAVMTSNNGKVAISQTALNNAQAALTAANEANAWQNLTIADQNRWLEVIKTFAPLMGQTSVELPGYKSTSTNNTKDLIEIFTAVNSTTPDEARKLMAKIPADAFVRIRKDLDNVVELAIMAGSKLAVGSGKAFLGGITDIFNKPPEMENYSYGRTETINDQGKRTETVRESTSGKRPKPRRKR